MHFLQHPLASHPACQLDFWQLVFDQEELKQRYCLYLHGAIFLPIWPFDWLITRVSDSNKKAAPSCLPTNSQPLPHPQISMEITEFHLAVLALHWKCPTFSLISLLMAEGQEEQHPLKYYFLHVSKNELNTYALFAPLQNLVLIEPYDLLCPLIPYLA